MRTRTFRLAVIILMAGMLTISALGQSDNGRGRYWQGGGGGGGRQGGGPNQGPFPPQMMDGIMLQLVGNDEEMQVLKPLIQAVIDAQRALSPGGRGGFGGPGGPGDPNNGQPLTDIQQAAADLRDTMNDPDATTDQIETKIQALHQARIKARDDLAAAQAALQAAVTVRQEAVLSLLGLLD